MQRGQRRERPLSQEIKVANTVSTTAVNPKRRLFDLEDTTMQTSNRTQIPLSNKTHLDFQKGKRPKKGNWFLLKGNPDR